MIERCDGGPLGQARFVVGLAGVLAAVEARGILHETLAPHMLRMPVWSFTATWPAGAYDAVWGVWLIASVGMTVGLFTRASCLLVTLAAGVYIQLDHQFYSNHAYLLAILAFLFTMGDAGAAYSCDALRNARRDVPAWPVALLKIQLSIVYAFAAISKVNMVYLSGAVLAANMIHGPLRRFPQLVDSPEWMCAAASASILVETALATGLWIPRWRKPLIVGGIAFHVLLIIVFPANQRPGLAVFTFEMIGLYVLFR